MTFPDDWEENNLSCSKDVIQCEHCWHNLGKSHKNYLNFVSSTIQHNFLTENMQVQQLSFCPKCKSELHVPLSFVVPLRKPQDTCDPEIIRCRNRSCGFKSGILQLLKSVINNFCHSRGLGSHPENQEDIDLLTWNLSSPMFFFNVSRNASSDEKLSLWMDFEAILQIIIFIHNIHEPKHRNTCFKKEN